MHASFLKNQDAATKGRIVPLYDFFGSSIRDPEIDALVVSTETQHRSEMVNQIRMRKGYKPLHLIVIDLVRLLGLDGQIGALGFHQLRSLSHRPGRFPVPCR